MRKFFLILISIILLVSSVSAVTMVGNIRFNETVSVGDTIQFPINLKLDNEKQVYFENITTSGSCKNFISLDKTSLVLIQPETVNAVFTIPPEATGTYFCKISFVSGELENSGTKMSMSIPITFKIKNTDQNGTGNISTIVPMAVQVTTIPTTVSTPTKIVVQATPTKEVTSNVSSQLVNEVPKVPAITYLVIGGIAAVSVIGFLVLRKKDEEDPGWELA